MFQTLILAGNIKQDTYAFGRNALEISASIMKIFRHWH